MQSNFIKGIRLRSVNVIMITLLLFILPFFTIAQPCQPPVLSYNEIYCPSAFDFTMGIFTDVGSTYIWYRDAQVKAGPRAGNGTAISYNFAVTSTADAGHYYVVKKTTGYEDQCVFSKTVAYMSTISGLTTTNIAPNSVSFSWEATVPNAIYEYEVVMNGLVVAKKSYYNMANATVNALSGGTNYNIRVKPQCGSGSAAWTTISFTTLPGQCSAIMPGYENSSGNFCTGQTVNVNYPGITGQQYTLLKNGSPVSGVVNGTGTNIDFSFNFDGVSSAGLYSILIAKPGCLNAESATFSVTEKTAVTNLTLQSVNEVLASFTWNSSNINSGYLYDTTSSINPPLNPTRLTYGASVTTNILPDKNYYFHVKPACLQGTTNAGWVSIPFSTPASVNCPPLVLGTCSTATNVNIEAGYGVWDFSGYYPVNSVGSSTPGKEKLYSFTPTETAVYYLDISSVQAQTAISYLYKPATAGCNKIGWTGIKSITSTGKYAIGMLNSGTTYFILLDNNNILAAQQSFKICKSLVAVPDQINTCLSTMLYVSDLSAFKEEFLLDVNGNLVASVNASAKQNQNTDLDSISYRVNSNIIRRDNQNREYLDRDFIVYGNQLEGLKVNFYFTASELNRLINEPNDGNADVSGVSDLQTSFSVNPACLSSVFPGDNLTLAAQLNSGSYNGDAYFIQVPLTSKGNYFLHGGITPLNFLCASNPGNNLPIVQGFNMPNTTLLPPCWSKVNNLADISFVGSSINPVTNVFEGTKYIFFNSYLYPAGTYSILKAPVINTQGYASVDIEFYWYNNNNPLYTSNIEGVQIEYSLDNTNWTWVNFVQRHDPSLPVGTGQWKKQRIALPAVAANKPVVFVRLVFFSQYGDNCALDAFTITPTAPCQDAKNLAVTSINATSIIFNWSPVPGVTNYEYKVDTLFPNNYSGIATSSNSGTATGLSPLTNYYLFVRPQCTPGIYGAWNSILVRTPASCLGQNTYWKYATPYLGSSYLHQWQIDLGNGNGFTNIANNTIYAGATSPSLTIINPPGNFSGYRYRCAVGNSFYPPGNYFAYSDIKIIRFENTWTGTISSAWSNGGNWSCGTVPDANTDISIPTGTTFSPQIISNVSCKSIKVAVGALLTISTNSILTISGK